MKYIETLRGLLCHLGLLNDKKPNNDIKLIQACNWVLNTEGYLLKHYEPVALQPILETLKRKKANSKDPGRDRPDRSGRGRRPALCERRATGLHAKATRRRLRVF